MLWHYESMRFMNISSCCITSTLLHEFHFSADCPCSIKHMKLIFNFHVTYYLNIFLARIVSFSWYVQYFWSFSGEGVCPWALSCTDFHCWWRAWNSCLIAYFNARRAKQALKIFLWSSPSSMILKFGSSQSFCFLKTLTLPSQSFWNTLGRVNLIKNALTGPRT